VPRLIRVFYDEQIQIAVGPCVAASPAAEHDDLVGIRRFDQAPDNLPSVASSIETVNMARS